MAIEKQDLVYMLLLGNSLVCLIFLLTFSRKSSSLVAYRQRKKPLDEDEPWDIGKNILLESEDQKQVPDPSLKWLCVLGQFSFS